MLRNYGVSGIAEHYAHLFAESRRQQAAILANVRTIPVPIFILDEQGNVLVSNDAAQRLLRSNMSQLFAGISRNIGSTAEIVIGDKTYLATSQHLAKVGTIVIMQDMSHVKQQEQARTEVLVALSHDLKSPLTSIMGYSELLWETANLDDKGKRYVKQIAFAADRMLEMIRLLLQATHEEVVLMDLTVVDIHSLAADVMRHVEGAALKKSVELVSESSGSPYLILGDPMRLHQMILNLVDNAIKYSPPNSRIRILLSYAPESLTIEVHDEGTGVSEDDLPHLFQKFYRGKQTAEHPGNGVGLSVVATVAAAHNGKAEAYNLPEGGAAFRVTLPGHLRVDGQPSRGIRAH